MFYLICKALHLFGAISWFVSIFYLPRFFVYHSIAAEENDEACLKRFIVMERRLTVMGWIGCALAVFFGLVMLAHPVGHAIIKTQKWLAYKLLLVFFLIFYYIYCDNIRKKLAKGVKPRPHKFYRYLNEVPTVILLGILLLAIVRPI